MSTERKDGGPAFPFQGVEFQEIDKTRPGVKTLVDVTNPGMSLRDYFAAKAMQGRTDYMSADADGVERNMSSLDLLAKRAYRMADAMLEAREAK